MGWKQGLRIVLLFLVLIVSVLSILDNIVERNVYSIIAYSSALIGIVCNILAVSLNNWKMPVYYPDNVKIKDIDSPIHRGYHKRKDIRLFYLSDFLVLAFPLKTEFRVFFFSIGDVFIAIALILFLGGIIA